ncbi:MAG TPA: hypothetical protein VMV49_07485 [Candidatus Deferrimicrobium sp.]|nr:hypothetical protein [Candidatus Deferrimicrobium sp.]
MWISTSNVSKPKLSSEALAADGIEGVSRKTDATGFEEDFIRSEELDVAGKRIVKLVE